MKSDHNGLDGLLEGFGEENRGTGWERTLTACTADGQILIPVAVPGVFQFDRHFVVCALTGRHFAAYLEFDVICLLFMKHLVSSCHCSIRGVQFGFGVLILPFFEGGKLPTFHSDFPFVLAEIETLGTVYSRVWHTHLFCLDYSSPDTFFLHQLLNRNLAKTSLMRTRCRDECLSSQARQVSITGVAGRTFADACKDGSNGRGSSGIWPDVITCGLLAQISLQSHKSRAAALRKWSRLAAVLIRYRP